eukprot:COSAG01_NODE_381_length_17848_cov_10.220338_12_plen_59_part_00
MEMRTILTHLFRDFTFQLTEAEMKVAAELGTAIGRGKNAGTMGPTGATVLTPFLRSVS